MGKIVVKTEDKCEEIYIPSGKKIIFFPPIDFVGVEDCKVKTNCALNIVGDENIQPFVVGNHIQLQGCKDSLFLFSKNIEQKINKEPIKAECIIIEGK